MKLNPVNSESLEKFNRNGRKKASRLCPEYIFFLQNMLYFTGAYLLRTGASPQSGLLCIYVGYGWVNLNDRCLRSTCDFLRRRCGNLAISLFGDSFRVANCRREYIIAILSSRHFVVRTFTYIYFRSVIPRRLTCLLSFSGALCRTMRT